MFGIFTFLFFVFAQASAIYVSPPDRDMGDLQKIMYVHVPSAWVAFAAFGVVLVWSVLFLATRNLKYRDFITVAKSFPELKPWALAWLKQIRQAYRYNRERVQQLGTPAFAAGAVGIGRSWPGRLRCWSWPWS